MSLTMRGHGRTLDISSMQKAKAVSCPGPFCLQSHSTLFPYCVLHQKGADSSGLRFPASHDIWLPACSLKTHR